MSPFEQDGISKRLSAARIYGICCRLRSILRKYSCSFAFYPTCRPNSFSRFLPSRLRLSILMEGEFSHKTQEDSAEFVSLRTQRDPFSPLLLSDTNKIFSATSLPRFYSTVSAPSPTSLSASTSQPSQITWRQFMSKLLKWLISHLSMHPTTQAFSERGCRYSVTPF